MKRFLFSIFFLFAEISSAYAQGGPPIPVTAAGASAGNAGAVQGVTGGVPVPVTGGVTAGTSATGQPYSPVSALSQTACNAASNTNAQLNPTNNDLKGNECDDLAAIGGTAILTGTGAQGAGSPRVTVAVDSATVAGSASIPAGTNLIGKFGIDQTTPGTTNGVQDASTGATGSAVPAKASFMGAQNSAGLSGIISCDSSVVYDASTSGSTQLVALSSGKIVYVCGYTIVSGGTVNVELDYGTGTACVTSPTKIVPAFQLTAQTGAVDGSPFYRGLKTAASNELCLKTSGGVAVQAIVYYTQF